MTIRDIARNPAMNPFHPMRAGFGGGQNPWFNNSPNAGFPQTAPDTNAAIRTAGHRLMEVLRGLGTTFPPIRAESSSPDVARVTIDNSRLRTTQIPRDMQVEVQQVARAQVNTGDALVRTDREVDTGSFTFEIEADGDTHEFTINIGAADDNLAIQRRMATAINQADIGIRATVATGANAGQQTSTLTLTAAQTGTDNAFTVTDVTGNLAESMGITTTTQESRNAIFALNNGAVQESQTNNIEIREGITLNLRDVGQTEITFSRDTENAAGRVQDIVSAINSMLNIPASGRATGVRGIDRLNADIRGALHTFSSQLAQSGINVGRRGLTINEATLGRAIEDGSIGRLFNSGAPFMNRISRIADQAATSNRFTNAPAPVNMTNHNNLFNFGNVFTHWSFINMMG
ncbi:MAG: hypothetical protein FWB91_12590 [Defluviitaleaceae bacterium]|nr:hypothetical protein [Defluviitaleaceae bacterium]